MNRNDVATMYIGFENRPGGKRRPVLILRDNVDELTLFKITSQYRNKSDNIKKQYYKIIDWHEAGCYKPSYIDIGELVSLDKAIVTSITKIGQLSTRDIKGLNVFITNFQAKNSSKKR